MPETENPCVFASSGCQKTFSSEKEMEDHRNKCPHSLKKCPMLCGAKIQAKLLVNHMSKDCPHRPQGCQFCKKEFYHKQIELHQDQCPQKPLICEYCNIEFLQKELSSHLGTCQKSPLPCAMSYFGCDFVGEASSRLPHETNTTSHLSLLGHFLSQMVIKNMEEFSTSIKNEILDIKQQYSDREIKYEHLEKKILDQNEIIEKLLKTIPYKSSMKNEMMEYNTYSEEIKALEINLKDLASISSKEFQNLAMQLQELSSKFSKENRSLREDMKKVNMNMNKEIQCVKNEIANMSYLQTETIQDLTKEMQKISTIHSEQNKTLKLEIESRSEDQIKEIQANANNIEEMYTYDLKEIQTMKSMLKKVCENREKEIQDIKNDFIDLSMNHSKEISNLSEETKGTFTNQYKEIQSLRKDMKDLATNHSEAIQSQSKAITDISQNHSKIIHNLSKEIKCLSNNLDKEINVLKKEMLKDSTNNSKEIQSFKSETKQDFIHQNKEIKSIIDEIKVWSAIYSKEIPSITTGMKNISENNSKEIKNFIEMFTKELKVISANQLKEIENIKSKTKENERTIEEKVFSKFQDLSRLGQTSAMALAPQRSVSIPHQSPNSTCWETSNMFDGKITSTEGQQLDGPVMVTDVEIDLTLGKENMSYFHLGELIDRIGKYLYGLKNPSGNTIGQFLFSTTRMEFRYNRPAGDVRFKHDGIESTIKYGMTKLNSEQYSINITITQQSKGENILDQFAYAVLALCEFTSGKTLYINSKFSQTSCYVINEKLFSTIFNYKESKMHAYLLLCKPQISSIDSLNENSLI